MKVLYTKSTGKPYQGLNPNDRRNHSMRKGVKNVTKNRS